MSAFEGLSVPGFTELPKCRCGNQMDIACIDRLAERTDTHSRAGMQSYRIEGGKLAETWLMLQPLGSVWTDAVAQEHWTSPPPIR